MISKFTYGRPGGLDRDSTKAKRGITTRFSFSFLALCAIILCMSAAGLAQELAATLTGTVTDPSGAVVAGASILVHSDDTGVDTPAFTTTNTGSFNITHLRAGRYTVTVKGSGFQTYLAKGVILNVAETSTLDVALKAGRVSETVEVTAENTTIQTTTAEQSGTVTGEQLRELALNNRNFEQLVILQPGVSSQLGDEVGFGLNENTTISVNGGRASANNWTVDGADINDSGSNGTITNTPSVDAIQEFTLERSNYDASFGRSGGGQIVVATKSGTNQFHGTGYEFNRNNLYNANNALNKIAIAGGATGPSVQTPIERYNDFGFTIGGPLEIPKLYHPVKNKTFFFSSEEWRHASTPVVQSAPVPTTAQLAGVFTTPIPVAPAGCVNASGGKYVISSSCFSQNANAYLKAFILPNPPNAGPNLLDESYSQLNNFRQDIIRLDQNVGDKIRVFARYMQDSVPENFPYGLWGATTNYPGVEPTSVNAPGRNTVANVTANISSKVVNEVEFADSWGAINASLSGIANSPAFVNTLLPTATSDPYGRAPNVIIGGGQYAGLGNGNAPYHERNIDKNIFDNLSIQHGNHTIRTGFTAAWMSKSENATNGAATFNFDNANGNDPFANFLLGQASNNGGFSQADRDSTPKLHYVNFEAYVQDDWKVTRRLTLNLGVRYSYFPSPTDSANILANFDPNKYSASVAATNAPIDPATGLFTAGNAATYSNGVIFPSGTACANAQAISSTVTCSPFGSRVNPGSNNNWGPRFGVAWDVWGNGKLAVRAGYGLFYDRTLNGIWENNAFGLDGPYAGDPPLTQYANTNNNAAESQNLFDHWNAGGAVTPLTPAALTMTGTPNASGSPIFKAPSYQDYNLSAEYEIMHNTVFQIGYVGTKGTHLLGDVDLNQPTVAARLADEADNVNAIRPYQGYAAVGDRSPVYTSNYNSLQASLNRRMSHGLTLGVAYTWSKLLTTNPQDRALGAADTYDLRSNYGLSTLNTPQILILSYVYQEPFFKTQRGLGWVLGGWELSGIANFQTGQSLSVTQTSDPFAVNGNGGLGMTASTAQIRADQIGNPRGPKTINEYFNTAAFVVASGHFGTSAPGAVLGPGFQRWDTSLLKNVRFGEWATLQLRLETFNTFNHTSPQYLCGDYSGDSNCIVGSGNFGQVTNYHIPRELQIGAKVTF
jgi:hypothetical protein